MAFSSIYGRKKKRAIGQFSKGVASRIAGGPDTLNVHAADPSSAHSADPEAREPDIATEELTDSLDEFAERAGNGSPGAADPRAFDIVDVPAGLAQPDLDLTDNYAWCLDMEADYDVEPGYQVENLAEALERVDDAIGAVDDQIHNDVEHPTECSNAPDVNAEPWEMSEAYVDRFEEQIEDLSPEESAQDLSCIASDGPAAVCENDERPPSERRKHPRDDSAQLIWLQYFDPSEDSGGREAGRTVNLSGGGMRVTVRTAPPNLERVKVSYPYRGFQSYAIVRNRFQDEDGIEHLCLEFADKDFEVSTADGAVRRGAHPPRMKKVLFADDDEPFRRIWGSILTRAGYDVILAEDGQSAVEEATREKPDIVITDGLMPKLHGFQVCEAVKRLVPQPKVIMLTAVYTSPNYLWQAQHRFGADDIITKPCEIADLLSRIEKYTSADLTAHTYA